MPPRVPRPRLPPPDPYWGKSTPDTRFLGRQPAAQAAAAPDRITLTLQSYLPNAPGVLRFNGLAPTRATVAKVLSTVEAQLKHPAKDMVLHINGVPFPPSELTLAALGVTRDTTVEVREGAEGGAPMRKYSKGSPKSLSAPPTDQPSSPQLSAPPQPQYIPAYSPQQPTPYPHHHPAPQPSSTYTPHKYPVPSRTYTPSSSHPTEYPPHPYPTLPPPPKTQLQPPPGAHQQHPPIVPPPELSPVTRPAQQQAQPQPYAQPQ
eukprot:Sspe_Gene.15521::Locus_5401_Transcript_1_1_Confidence_1.000_Length_900::g.15521::m.15521